MGDPALLQRYVRGRFCAFLCTSTTHTDLTWVLARPTLQVIFTLPLKPLSYEPMESKQTEQAMRPSVGWSCMAGAAYNQLLQSLSLISGFPFVFISSGNFSFSFPLSIPQASYLPTKCLNESDL